MLQHAVRSTATLSILIAVALLSASATPQRPLAASEEAPEVVPPARKPVVTQIAWSGDDGLTQRFIGTLRDALETSEDFDLSPQPAREKLRLYIPRHVYWAEENGRTNFQYVVILTNQDSKYLGVSIGSCWDEQAEIVECAQTVLREAADAWKRRDQPQAWPR